MKMMKLKRFGVTAVLVIVFFLLQSTVFQALSLANIKPNLLIILTASFGFMRGTKEGMLVGLVSGLLIDIQFGSIIGFYGLIYLLFGYTNGLFKQMYFDEDIKLPLILISASNFVYGLIVYFFRFMLRGEFDFLHYLNRIIIPELIYTFVIALGLYPLILWVSKKLETEEKRSASKFV